MFLVKTRQFIIIFFVLLCFALDKEGGRQSPENTTEAILKHLNKERKINVNQAVTILWIF